MAGRLVGFFTRGHGKPSEAFPELTAHEREVLIRGTRKHHAMIASALDIGEKTVRNHLSNIFTKLHVVDRGQAVIRARDAGLE